LQTLDNKQDADSSQLIHAAPQQHRTAGKDEGGRGRLQFFNSPNISPVSFPTSPATVPDI
jgi:hypothetical protein